MRHQSKIEDGHVDITLSPTGAIEIHVRYKTTGTTLVIAPVDAMHIAGDLYTQGIATVTEQIIADSDARLQQIEDALDQQQARTREREASDWFQSQEHS